MMGEKRYLKLEVERVVSSWRLMHGFVVAIPSPIAFRHTITWEGA